MEFNLLDSTSGQPFHHYQEMQIISTLDIILRCRECRKNKNARLRQEEEEICNLNEEPGVDPVVRDSVKNAGFYCK